MSEAEPPRESLESASRRNSRRRPQPTRKPGARTGRSRREGRGGCHEARKDAGERKEGGEPSIEEPDRQAGQGRQGRRHRDHLLSQAGPDRVPALYRAEREAFGALDEHNDRERKDTMTAKKTPRVGKRVKALPAKGLSSKHARGIQGGATRGKQAPVELQGWDWEVESMSSGKKIK